jgi:PAS domain S-box-containing protein
MLALLLLFGLGLIIFNGVYFMQKDRERAIEAAEVRCKREGSRLARLVKTHLRGDREDAAMAELQRAEDEKNVLHATVCSSDLRVLFDAKKAAVGNVLSDHSDAVAAAPYAIGSKTVVKHVGLSADVQRVVGYFPFDYGKREPHLAVLVVELDLVEPLYEASAIARTNALGASLALAVALVLMWLLLHFLVTKRVTNILREALALTQGEPSGHPLGGNDELAQIDRAMREAHARIAEQGATLRAREERYRLMVETLPEMVLVIRDGKIEFINSTGLMMVRASDAAEVVEQEAYAFLIKGDAENANEPSDIAEDSSLITSPCESILKRLDGTKVEVSYVASTFRDERGLAVQVAIHDISERKAAEAKREALAKEISEERQRLEHEIVKASEREQRRMGQDLHDDICQRLAAVKMNMQDLEERIAEQSPALVDHADAIVDKITDAIRITRRLARGLSPVDIEAGGLGSALLGLVRSAREIFGIECHLDLDEELPSLNDHSSTQIYRIAQESVANAAKHGQAHLVRVALHIVANKGLLLRVSNDGLPLSPSADITSGMGLPIMRYRAESMGATLDFETNPPDASVAVNCLLPLSVKQPNEKST